MKPARHQREGALHGLCRDAAWSLAPALAATLAAAFWGFHPRFALLSAAIVLAGFAVILAGLWRRNGARRASSPDLGAPEPSLRLTLHPVTGLAVREHLLEVIAADIAAEPCPRWLGVVRLVDFDRMASFDRAAAERALRSFANRLKTSVKPEHFVAQIDRDCICVWYRGDIDLDTAALEFRALAYLASQEIADLDPILTPSIEAGAARYPVDGEDAAHLLLRATAALSRPTVSEQGELELIEPPSMEAAREQFRIEQDLAQAIIEEQLTMCFQPVVDLKAGRLIGAEALLRWDHPVLGPVSPARFIPIVESIGLSDRFGLWVLNAACREARAWQDAGLEGLKVAVNLSAKQLADPALSEKVKRTLERHAILPGGLELELTETAAMSDAGRTLHLFSALRAMGVSLAIDDFGSGYSSLSYLKTLPFDKLKIDREFVTAIHERRDSQAICKALIELGRGLDLHILAEGVETRAEVDQLQALGCHIFQGYYFSKPLSGETFRQLAARPEGLGLIQAPAAARAPGANKRIPA